MIALNCHVTPSDYLDPHREELWGMGRMRFDLYCLKEALERQREPTTTVEKVRRKYEELGIDTTGIDYHG